MWKDITHAVSADEQFGGFPKREDLKSALVEHVIEVEVVGFRLMACKCYGVFEEPDLRVAYFGLSNEIMKLRSQSLFLWMV